jgi:NADH:ubiquinone oxidoreductase subunit 3 (subunit A)
MPEVVITICICTSTMALLFILIQGLLEARQELRTLLFKSKDRLKDLLFLDIALDSTVRTVIERGYEELNNARPEVNLTYQQLLFAICYVQFVLFLTNFYPIFFSTYVLLLISFCNLYIFLITSLIAENYVLHHFGS